MVVVFRLCNILSIDIAPVILKRNTVLFNFHCLIEIDYVNAVVVDIAVVAVTFRIVLTVVVVTVLVTSCRRRSSGR